ncbi:hypothetical protein ACFVJ8_20205 [Streptomyces yangpuensis]|uniref:hypothetical protein n=1 Tax=Streptomyces yangpuensis TaxID=1648182 RepID=UPI00363E3D6A
MTPHLRPVTLDPALPSRRTVTLLRRENAYESAASRALTALPPWSAPAATPVPSDRGDRGAAPRRDV